MRSCKRLLGNLLLFYSTNMALVRPGKKSRYNLYKMEKLDLATYDEERRQDFEEGHRFLPHSDISLQQLRREQKNFEQFCEYQLEIASNEVWNSIDLVVSALLFFR